MQHLSSIFCHLLWLCFVLFLSLNPQNNTKQRRALTKIECNDRKKNILKTTTKTKTTNPLRQEEDVTLGSWTGHRWNTSANQGCWNRKSKNPPGGKTFKIKQEEQTGLKTTTQHTDMALNLLHELTNNKQDVHNLSHLLTHMVKVPLPVQNFTH